MEFSGNRSGKVAQAGHAEMVDMRGQLIAQVGVGFVDDRASALGQRLGNELSAIGLAVQFLIIKAYELGEASLIAPLEYTALVWGVALDLALWGVLPDAVTWLGAAIIIASGLYLIRRENMHGESVHAEAEHP